MRQVFGCVGTFSSLGIILPDVRKVHVSLLDFGVWCILKSMKKYCFLDLETTGFEAKDDSIIECSYVITDENLKEIERYDQVFCPDKSALSDIVTDITGITQEELDKEGKVFADEKDNIATMIQNLVIVGHNIDFDIRFLRENGIDIDPNKRIDTHEIARLVLLDEESYALEVLTAKYDMTHGNAHRAMSDVEANIPLFAMLCKKIDALPAEFLVQLREVLGRYEWWWAKELFADVAGANEYTKYASPKSKALVAEDLDDTWKAKIFEGENQILVAAGERTKTDDKIKSVAKEYITKGEKVAIVTPFIDFFAGLPVLPTPEVLLSEDRLSEFESKHGITEAGELAFYIKCLYRSFLGYRGKHFFALFFNERELWKWVCMQNIEEKKFVSIMEEKAKEDVLVLTPYAWGKFRSSICMHGRVMVIDEAEMFAEKMIETPTREISLRPYLDSKKSEVSNAAHFFVADFCKTVVEKVVGHQIGHFPERKLLPPRDTYSEFVGRLSDMGDDTNLQFLADSLGNPQDNMARWFDYAPHNATLSFGFWKGEDFRELINDIASYKKVIFHRQGIWPQAAFWRVFWDIKEFENLVDEDLFNTKTLEIPKNLESSKSPGFPEFCSKKVAEMARNKKHNMVVYCSSLDTLRKMGLHLRDMLVEDDITVYGEKMAGGDGKLLQKVGDVKGQLVMLAQKIYRKEVQTLGIKTFVVQKFPFTPPQPLLDYFDEILKPSGQKMWDLWTIPQIAGRLSRYVSIYPEVENIVCLDPAENSTWGKNILRIAFDVWQGKERD